MPVEKRGKGANAAYSATSRRFGLSTIKSTVSLHISVALRLAVNYLSLPLSIFSGPCSMPL